MCWACRVPFSVLVALCVALACAAPDASAQQGKGKERPQEQRERPDAEQRQETREARRELREIRELSDVDQQLAEAQRLLESVRGNPRAEMAALIALAGLQLNAYSVMAARQSVEAALRLTDALAILPHMSLLVLKARIAFAGGDRALLEAVVGEQQELLRRSRRNPRWERIQWTMTLQSERGRYLLYSLIGDLKQAELAARTGLAAAERHWKAAAARAGADEQDEVSGERTGLVQVFLRYLASVLSRSGRLVEAEAVGKRALELARTTGSGSSMMVVLSLGTLASILVEQGRYREAEQTARSAIAAAESFGLSGISPVLATMRGHLGNTLAMQEHWSEALVVYQARIRAFSGNPSASQALRLGSVSWALALIKTGRHAEALRLIETMSRRLSGFAGENSFGVALLRGLAGLAHAEAGRSDAALAEFRRAVPALLESAFLDLQEEHDGPARVARLNYVLEGYLRALAQEHQRRGGGASIVEEMFKVADFARASGVQRALTAGAARAANRDPALARLVEEEEGLAQRMLVMRDVLQGLETATAERRSGKVIADLSRDVETIALNRVRLHDEIRRRFPEYANLVTPRPVTLQEARAVLAPDEALVSIYLAETQAYVWAIARDRAVAFTTVALPSGEAAQLVRKLRLALDVGTNDLAAFPRYDLALAASLYGLLLMPVEEAWKPARHLLVVPHRALSQLPFALLATSPAELMSSAELFAGYRTVPWLARSHAITQLPAVSSLLALRRLPPPRGGRLPFAGFGDPVFWQVADPTSPASAQPGVALRGVGRTSAASKLEAGELATLAALPDTAEEIRSIAGALKADTDRDLFLGVRASEENAKGAALADRRVIVFATHGLVPGELKGLAQPALALSNPKITGGVGDGLLGLDEILEMRLDADWVVLSACNTGAADGAGGEAVSGLGRAFFYAGARALLVSNWPVESVAAKLLTADLFSRQAADPKLSRAEALRQAMLALLDHGAARDAAGKTLFTYAHPMFWAPFSVVGDGASN